MKRVHIWLTAAVVGALVMGAVGAYALDPPHNAASSPPIGCGQCHYTHSTPEADWWQGGYSLGDDTPLNRICLGCHNDSSTYNGMILQIRYTHSSIETSTDYGTWNWECVDCHNPHYQQQLRAYRSAAFVQTATLGSVAAATNSTIVLSAPLTEDYEGYLFIPNTTYWMFAYKIINSTAGTDTFKVRGQVLTQYAKPGNTSAFVYGRLIKNNINGRAVRFFNSSGSNSYADGVAPYDNVCEACHTKTAHFRNDGTGTDQLHENLSNGSPAATDCRGCHSHSSGFAHGSGAGGACSDCHGKDADNGGVGTTVSHSTHTENDADDQRGPFVACSECHDTNNFPTFKDGKALAETGVCDTCHSPGGSYDGVSDLVIGAKANWRTGVYIANSIPAEKERWCATCHDESAALVNSVSAPGVIGNETTATDYGVGYGYYTTGHGLDTDTKFPASGIVNGPGLTCDACHDYSLPHVDGIDRTFNCSDGCDSAEYREGYRLSLLNGSMNPMVMPLFAANSVSNFPLCYSCHTSGPFLGVGDTYTNFKYPPTYPNLHAYHLSGTAGFNGTKYPVDWRGANNSEITCVACHNVHGSRRFTMVRDGSLTGLDPNMRMWYYNSTTTTFYSMTPPDPTSVQLAFSDGVVYHLGSLDSYCANCHGGNNVLKLRDPYQDTSMPPTLDWTGSGNFTSDGVNPDAGFANTVFEFRVEYTDANNDPPVSIKLQLDDNDTDACTTPDRVFDLAEVNPLDTVYYDGKIYATTLELGKTVGNTVTYCFAASDATGAAVGPAVSNMPVSVTNYPPVLAWTAESGYETDGVLPDSGGSGTEFTFRVVYTDYNNDAPAMANLVVDGSNLGAMAEVDSGDVTYTDGKLYTKALPVGTVGPHTYRFAFADAEDAATGQGIANSPFTVTDGLNAPVLDWTTGTGFENGVDPDFDAEWRWYEFRVMYTDIDNSPPTVVQAWIDMNNTSGYEPSEMFAMSPADPSDTDYSDGKIYTFHKQLTLAGLPAPKVPAEGARISLDYRFYAEDETSRTALLNNPVSGGKVGIINGLVVPDEYATIKTAVAATQNGEHVVVKDGFYNEDGITITRTGISLLSVNGPSATIINGSGTQQVVDFNMFAGVRTNSLIEGFSIYNGTKGINVIYAATARVRDCVVENNRYGGGIVSGGPLTVEDSIVRSNINNSSSGGGISLTIVGANHSILNTTVSGNIANSTALNQGRGGGIYTTSVGTLTIAGSIINGNSAYSIGGGVFLNAGTLKVDSSAISGNASTSNAGGALYLLTSATASITNSTIQGNSSAGHGGGIFVNNGTYLSMTNVLVTGNRAGGLGGAIYEGDDTAYQFCTISANRSDTANGGGGLYHNGTFIATVANSVVYGNMPEQTRVNSNFNWLYVDVYNTLINQAPGSSGTDGLFSYENKGGNDIVNSPGFVDGRTAADAPTTAGDYHLLWTSPAIDAAGSDPGVTRDIDGDARPSGNGYDMGADEYMAE